MKKVTAHAPVNIALIKYWGKKDPIDVLPYNPSISLSLKSLCTKTTLIYQEQPGVTFYIDDILQSEEEHKKVIDFLSWFDGFSIKEGLKIQSYNDVPTAAGFASSASGFAALTIAANHYYQCQYPMHELVRRARLGSGSSVRSLLGGVVLWHTDGSIQTLDANVEDWLMIGVVINDQKKDKSSREMMAHTVKTSFLFETWVKQSHQDAQDMGAALKYHNFHAVGTLMEQNGLLMHATLLCASPPYTYVLPQSLKVYEIAHTLRKKGIEVYATMDAGPNVKLLTKKKFQEDILNALKDHQLHALFISEIDKIGAYIVDADI